MRDAPVRVAVISPNPLVRSGLIGLISELGAHALVTEAVALDRKLISHDVAIYDVGAATAVDTYDELQALIEGDVQVIALVYDRVLNPLPAVLGDTTHVITLSVTATELLQVLERVTVMGALMPRADMPAGLSHRELEILRLIASDLSNGEIAARLYLSVNTVKTYIRAAYRKIGASNRSGAIHWAMQHGLASDTPQAATPNSPAARRTGQI